MDPAHGQRPLVALVSHDPRLEWSLAISGSGWATLFQGSLEGLDQFKAGAGVMCGLHIEHVDSNGWNLEIVQTEFKQSAAVLMHWAIRDRGLIVGKSILDPINCTDWQSPRGDSAEDRRGILLV
jgi:Periplasmic molybdate-binding protein/domain